ncbi:hypothetical protein DY000_02003768 [Brassica cretica]|uniref:Uncharacterized protein n=1 Tax=Brassica cretica TaxID=69181 RepID=A0ABQ7CDF1_BRACR|nr:hypothetical protein DY000_02003768 [Brassica cretica]
MSRCFPFPPPGYEKKISTDEANPLIKEEHRVNGFIDSQEPKDRPKKVKENGETSAKKRPHPDLKYLDQILNVPQREELCEVGENEEQEWLFGQSGVKLLKKPRIDSSTSLDEGLQVWNQALRLESADTVALPYVQLMQEKGVYFLPYKETSLKLYHDLKKDMCHIVQDCGTVFNRCSTRVSLGVELVFEIRGDARN